MTVLGLIARREARWASVWVLLVAALTVVAAPAYAATYATVADRRAAVLAAQRDAATTLLYGRLPDPGTPAQLLVWEVGAFTTLLVAVAAVLGAVRVTRAAEDSGMVEVIRSCGVRRGAPLAAAVTWLAFVAALLGLSAAGGVVVTADSVPGATVTGASAYGLTVAATFLLTASMTLIVAQVAPSTVATRRGALLLVGAAVVARAYGDSRGVPAVAALSPLGLRGTVRPFTDDRLMPLLWALVVAGSLTTVAVRLAEARDVGTGLVRERQRHARRLRVSGPLGLTARLEAGSVLTWAVAVTATTALLTAMSASVVASAEADRLDGGFLGDQLNGADPTAAYFAYVGTVTGVAVSVMAVLTVLRTVQQERGGLLEHLRATGVRRWAPLCAHAAVAALAALAVLASAAGAAATVAPLALSGGSGAGHALREVLGQWPGVVVLVGVATLVAGAAPRVSGLAWVPFATSTALTLLGSLIGVPDAVLRWSAFGHAPDGWQWSALDASAALLAVGTAAALAGTAAAAGRDQVVS